MKQNDTKLNKQMMYTKVLAESRNYLAESNKTQLDTKVILEGQKHDLDRKGGENL